MIGFELLITGLAIFMVFHVLSGVYVVRQKLVDMLGKVMFRIVHSLGSIVGMVFIVMGYGDAPLVDFYEIPSWGLKAPIFLMPIALICLAGSSPSSDFNRVTRHPMLWFIVLWSGAHLLANGDKASVLLFGSFFAYGLLAMFLSDNKKANANPEEWEKVAATTSIIPFAALFAKRTEPARGDHGLKAVVLGLFIYSLLLWTHGYFAGVALIKL